MESPFNENLIVASVGCNVPFVADLFLATTNTLCTGTPMCRTVRVTATSSMLDLQQAFGKYFVLNGEYIWKYTTGAYDFSVLGNNAHHFIPSSGRRSKIPGFAVRGTVPNFHGLSAFIVLSSVSARFYNPQVAGLGSTPGGVAGSVFRIDHDEKYAQTVHAQYQPFKRGPWFGFNWRYDSGLVAGPVPCAGGNCANGPAGTDNIVDASGLSPDQQFQAGLFCGNVHATPTTPISPNSICPASQYGSTLVKIPAAGTENDDHNPPRIAPRNLFDLSVGDDDLLPFHNDAYKWSLRFTVINLTNKEALYNFLSTFSGTHYVSPRSETVELGFHF